MYQTGIYWRRRNDGYRTARPAEQEAAMRIFIAGIFIVGSFTGIMITKAAVEVKEKIL